MPKAYWIAHVTVTDPDTYANYITLAPAVFKQYGGRFLARGEQATTLEGESWQRHVVIEFESVEAAHACYNSAEYSNARQERDGACLVSITIIEGL
jgi:uncharacterized protein (DUF1330 family)